MPAFFGVVYVAVMLSFIYLTRNLAGWKISGMADLLMLLGMRYLCLLCGNADRQAQDGTSAEPEEIRRRELSAALSVRHFLARSMQLRHQWTDGWSMQLICAVGALISMVGDLAASAIKRNQGIKDYGKLIPGHGGILDRFDSVIFTAPVIYYLGECIDPLVSNKSCR